MICPRCGESFERHPAVTREVCDPCAFAVTTELFAQQEAIDRARDVADGWGIVSRAAVRPSLRGHAILTIVMCAILLACAVKLLTLMSWFR